MSAWSINRESSGLSAPAPLGMDLEAWTCLSELFHSLFGDSVNSLIYSHQNTYRCVYVCIYTHTHTYIPIYMYIYIYTASRSSLCALNKELLPRCCLIFRNYEARRCFYTCQAQSAVLVHVCFHTSIKGLQSKMWPLTNYSHNVANIQIFLQPDTKRPCWQFFFFITEIFLRKCSRLWWVYTSAWIILGMNRAAKY